jgi:hypothetical protein
MSRHRPVLSLSIFPMSVPDKPQAPLSLGIAKPVTPAEEQAQMATLSAELSELPAMDAPYEPSVTNNGTTVCA